MNSRTHLVCGVAAALTLLRPVTAQGIFLAVIGGSVGGVLPDIDLLSKEGRDEILPSQVTALWTAVILLTADFFLHTGICDSVLARERTAVLLGAALFVTFGVLGALTAHRTFTHSLVGWLLYSVSVRIFCPLLLPAFAAGFGSHLVLDLLNHRKVTLFYPTRAGFCLDLCRSDGLADALLFFLCSALVLCLLLFGAATGLKQNILL